MDFYMYVSHRVTFGDASAVNSRALDVHISCLNSISLPQLAQLALQPTNMVVLASQQFLTLTLFKAPLFLPKGGVALVPDDAMLIWSM